MGRLLQTSLNRRLTTDDYSHMKVLVLSPYTTGQKYKPDNLLRGEDCGSPEHLEWRIKELCGYNDEGWYHESRDYSAPAGEMFTGPLNVQLRAGLKQIKHRTEKGVAISLLAAPAGRHVYRNRHTSPRSPSGATCV